MRAEQLQRPSLVLTNCRDFFPNVYRFFPDTVPRFSNNMLPNAMLYLLLLTCFALMAFSIQKLEPCAGAQFDNQAESAFATDGVFQRNSDQISHIVSPSFPLCLQAK